MKCMILISLDNFSWFMMIPMSYEVLMIKKDNMYVTFSIESHI